MHESNQYMYLLSALILKLHLLIVYPYKLQFILGFLFIMEICMCTIYIFKKQVDLL